MPSGQEGRDLPQDLVGSHVGRYVVLSRLGGGYQGEVYLARHVLLNHNVALKRLAPRWRAYPEFRRRFLDTGRRASVLVHDHIARVYDFFEEQDEPFLVMEYVEGATLRQRLRTPIGVGQSLQIARQTADALAFAHEHDVVHGDVKPENIMLAPGDQVKILDFGVARALPHADPGAETEGSDDVGAPAGTMAYMAPEQLREEEGDGRADLFSLGVVLYEAIAGRHPFLQPDRETTKEYILSREPSPVRARGKEAEVELNRILRRALAKAQGERYG